MLTNVRHHQRPALVAFAILAGLLLATGGASASCEAMKSARGGACPPSKVACCCNPPAGVESRVSVVLPGPEALGPIAACCCSERPEVPAEPVPEPARPVDQVRADRGGTLAVEPPGLRPSPLIRRSRPDLADVPAHVPIFLRNSRFLI